MDKTNERLTRDEIEDILYAQARGSYQRSLILGTENWSGSSLKGKAREYSGRYAQSAGRLLKRCQEALGPYGCKVYTKRVPTGGRKKTIRRLVVEPPEGKPWVF